MNGLAQSSSPSTNRTGGGISDTLSKMKFMQNKKEAAYRDELQAKLEKSIKDSHWVAKGSFDGETLNTASQSEIIGFKSVGRMSFGSFNSNLDKLNKEKQLQNKQLESSRPKEIENSNLILFNDNDDDDSTKTTAAAATTTTKQNEQPTKTTTKNNNNKNNNINNVNRNNDKRLKNTVKDAEEFLSQVLETENKKVPKRKNENNDKETKKKFKNK